MDSLNNWIDIKLLSVSYKELVDHYFENYSGKYKFENNTLFLDFDSWGLEKIYINEDSYGIVDDENYFYNVHYNNFEKLYSISVLIQIGNWNTFKKMEHYLNNFENINVNIYFVLINELASDDNIDHLKNNFKKSVILSGENRGMDIGLFFIALHYLKKKNIIMIII